MKDIFEVLLTLWTFFAGYILGLAHGGAGQMNIREEASKIVDFVPGKLAHDGLVDAIESLVTRAVNETLEKAANIADSCDLAKTPIGWEGSVISNKILALKSKKGEGNEGDGNKRPSDRMDEILNEMLLIGKWDSIYYDVIKKYLDEVLRI